jgi:hypothetical protein
MRNLNVATALLVIVASAALAGTARSATGGSVLDQTSTSATSANDGIVSQAHAARASQTFTAGVSGLLTDVTVKVANETGWPVAGDLRVAINPVDGFGNADTAVELAVQTTPVATLSTGSPADVDFAFVSPPTLVAGTRYAITLSEINGTHQHVWWAGNSSDVYGGGHSSDTLGGFATTGDLAFATYMAATTPLGGSRSGYCSAAGNTWADGSRIPVGTFLNLIDGQNSADASFAGATPAFYLEGLGISCDVPPGYAATRETVGYDGLGDPGTYLYYAKTH